jgi:PilZ domain
VSDNIATAVPDQDQVPASDDRRAGVRHLVNARATCRPLTDAAERPVWKGQVRDIANLGIGLLLTAHLKPGTLLDIDLANQQGNWIGAMRARVVHVEKLEEGFWLVGCAFVTELDDAELRMFNAEKVAPSVPDGRRWVRYPCNVETVCYTSETAPGERRRAQIVNISAGGVGLLLPCEFSKGTILRLELPLGVLEPPRLLLLRVVHCNPHEHRYFFLGCEFADQLGDGEIQALRV